MKPKLGNVENELNSRIRSREYGKIQDNDLKTV